MDTSVYFAITKSEKQADGTVMVYGKATGPDLDLDQQICDPAWLAKAMPAWMAWGNVREQHSQIAAGVAVDLVQEGDDWWVKTHVVDSGTCAKLTCDPPVLKGYSIGIRGCRVIKDAAAPGGRIVDGIIPELSLVDRPCNPTTIMGIVTKSTGGFEMLNKSPVVDANKFEGDGTISADMAAADTTVVNDPAVEVVEEAAEVDCIEQMRQLATAWLASEAAEVAANVGSLYIVRLLLNLISDMDWLKIEDQMDDISMAVKVDAMKAAYRDTKPLQTGGVIEKTASVGEVITLTSSGSVDVDELVERVTKAFNERWGAKLVEVTKTVSAQAGEAESGSDFAAELAKVRDELATIKSMTVPGGPHRTRLPEALDLAADREKSATVARYRRLADQATDSELRQGYEALISSMS
jgi:hypothetical protein